MDPASPFPRVEGDDLVVEREPNIPKEEPALFRGDLREDALAETLDGSLSCHTSDHQEVSDRTEQLVPAEQSMDLVLPFLELVRSDGVVLKGGTADFEEVRAKSSRLENDHAGLHVDIHEAGGFKQAPKYCARTWAPRSPGRWLRRPPMARNRWRRH